MREVRIEVEIDHEGRISADADGFSGNACLRDLERLLEGLGIAQEQLERKPDAGERQARTARTRKQTTGRRR